MRSTGDVGRREETATNFFSAEIRVGYRQIMFGREDKIVKVFNYLTYFIDLFSLCIPREFMLV